MRIQNVMVSRSDIKGLPAATMDALKAYLTTRLDLPASEIVVSVHWNAKPVNDKMMASWEKQKEDSVLLTAVVGSMTAELSSETAVSTQLTKVIDSVSTVPNAKAAENMLQMISDSLHEMRISTFDAALGAAHRTRFRLFDEAQFSPRMLWPNDTAPTGVIIQYSTIQPYMIYLPFSTEESDDGSTAAFANLMLLYRSDGSGAAQSIARPPADNVPRILTPVIAPMEQLERVLDAVEPSYLLLFRQLTKHHVALLETGNRLHLFSIDLLLYIYMGQMREEAGSPILPFFTLYRRISEEMDKMGVSATERHQPPFILYYIYLCYVHWQGMCFGRDFAASMEPPEDADAIDYIQHFIKTHILDVYYRAAPLRATNRLLSQLARVAPLTILLDSIVKDNRAHTKQRRYLLFRRENTRWYDQYEIGAESLRRLQINAADAIASNLLLQFVNAHWQLSGLPLELRFPTDETAPTRSQLWLIDPAAPNDIQAVHLVFDAAEARVLLADVDPDGNVAEHHVIIVSVDQPKALERRASDIRSAVVSTTPKYDDAFYDKLHRFMEGVQTELSKVAARDAALHHLDQQVREIQTEMSTIATRDAALHQATLPRMRRSIDELRTLLQSLVDRQIVPDVFYDVLEDVEAMETQTAMPARLQSTVVQMADTLLERTSAAADSSMHNARVIYDYGSDMIRSALSAARALEDMVLQHGILPETRRFLQDADAARGALQYVVVPTLTAGQNAVVLWFRGARKTAYMLVSNAAMAASESAPVLAEEATAAVNALTRAAVAVRRQVDVSVLSLDFESIVNESDYVRPESATTPIESTPINPGLAVPMTERAVSFLSAVTESFSTLMRLRSQEEHESTAETVVGSVQDQRHGATYPLIRGSDGVLFFFRGSSANDNRKMIVRHAPVADARGQLHIDLYRAYYDAPMGWRWIRTNASANPFSVYLHQRAWTTDVLVRTWLGAESRASDLDYIDYYYVSADGRIVVVNDKDLMQPPAMVSTSGSSPSQPPPPPPAQPSRSVPSLSTTPTSHELPEGPPSQTEEVPSQTTRAFRRARRREAYIEDILNQQRQTSPLLSTGGGKGSGGDKSKKM